MPTYSRMLCSMRVIGGGNPYLCNHRSSSLTPNRTGSVRAMPAPNIRSVYVNMCSSLTTTILYTTTAGLSITIMSSSC